MGTWNLIGILFWVILDHQLSLTQLKHLSLFRHIVKTNSRVSTYSRDYIKFHFGRLILQGKKILVLLIAHCGVCLVCARHIIGRRLSKSRSVPKLRTVTKQFSHVIRIPSSKRQSIQQSQTTIQAPVDQIFRHIIRLYRKGQGKSFKSSLTSQPHTHMHADNSQEIANVSIS